jgi:two-component system sensor histidine kinase BaeS
LTQPGSGIGLTIARSLVTAQGGTLTAFSAGPGQGATFTMTLPLA